MEGNFFYNNIEWYLQDNWKVNRKLTLDYGLRFVQRWPVRGQAQAGGELLPGEVVAGERAGPLRRWLRRQREPLHGNNRQAKDPRTGALLGTGTPSLIGAVIPGSGAFDNGMIQAGNGISDAGYTWPALVVGPRFGAAYDVTGQQKYVVRGSHGPLLRPSGRQHRVRHGGQPADRDGHHPAVGPAVGTGQLVPVVRAGAAHRRQRVRLGHPEGLPVEPRRAGGAAVALVPGRLVRRAPSVRRARPARRTATR